MSTPSLDTIARQMTTLAENIPWKPGMKLRPYRRAYEKRIEISYYVDTEKSQTVLEIVSLDAKTIPADEAYKIRTAFQVPPGAILYTRDYKIVWRWITYVQKKMFSEVK